jgi:hypothetical protein
MNKKFHFLNHTSIVLQHEGYYLLLDPWPSEFLSFNSWKAHPPCFLDNNILASFVNSSEKKLGVVISHGHDDHCDDDFLKKVNSSTPVFFPKYKGKGPSKRLEKNNLENVSELSSLQNTSFGPFKLCSYIIEDHSLDDAIVIISTDDYIFVHANDNSVKFPSELIEYILNDRDGYKKVFFASQTGIANGYPYCYPQFAVDNDFSKMKKIALDKIKKTVQIAIDNANLVKSDHFISYAAYTISMSLLEEYGSEILPAIFLPTPSNLKKLSLNWGKVGLLDYVPGDTFDFTNNSISKPFWLENNNFENIASELQKLRLKSTKDFRNGLNMNIEKFNNYSITDLMSYLKEYLKKFYEFILKSEDEVKKELMKIILEFKIENHASLILNLKNGSISTNNDLKLNKRIIISKDNCWLLMSGIFNFESLYIGHHAKFERFPPEKFNKKLMMQLQIFGYIYQKRLVPPDLLLVRAQKS